MLEQRRHEVATSDAASLRHLRCPVELPPCAEPGGDELVDRFTRELVPLVLSGPPGATGFGEGRPAVREIVAYWSALIPRQEIQTRVEVVS